MVWLAASLGILLALTSGPIVAVAGEIEIGLEQAVTVQSNLFRSETDSVADGNYEIKPIIRIRDEGPRYGYLLEYRPSYDAYFDTTGVDGFNHFFRGAVFYDPAPTSTIRFKADVTDYRSVRAIAEAGPSDIPDIVPQTTGRINRAFLDLDLEHDFSPSTTATAGLGFQSYSYSTPNNPDSLGFSVDTSLTHWLTGDFAVGGSLLGGYRQFEELAPQPASENAVVNANLTLLFEPVPTLFIELSAGPAGVFTRQDDPSNQRVSRFVGADTILGPIVGVFQTNPALASSCQSVGGQFLLDSCPLRIVPGFPGDFTEQVNAVFASGSGAYSGSCRTEIRKSRFAYSVIPSASYRTGSSSYDSPKWRPEAELPIRTPRHCSSSEALSNVSSPRSTT